MSTLKRWLLHYIYGLWAQAFNGAISSVVGVVGAASTGDLKNGITFALIWHTVLIAMGTHALLYFRSNPLPTELPYGTLTPPFPIIKAQTSDPPTPQPTNPPTP